MNPSKKKALGKGLDAILGPVQLNTVVNQEQPDTPNTDAPEANEKFLYLSPNDILPSKYQVRRNFSEQSLQELAESIKKHGLQEPVIVRWRNNSYELVCGERRLRASILAGLESIPAICRDITDEEAMLIGLIENIQREDLNPIEEAEAYQTILNKFQWSQEQLAETISKDRSTIANTLRLLTLPEFVQQQLIEGTITPGHARALLRLESAEHILQITKKILEQKLSVRETETLVNHLLEGKKKRQIAKKEKHPQIIEIENALCRRLGTKVTVTPKTKGRGKIEVQYFSNDELIRILNILGIHNSF